MITTASISILLVSLFQCMPVPGKGHFSDPAISGFFAHTDANTQIQLQVVFICTGTASSVTMCLFALGIGLVFSYSAISLC
jgi:hypothetical protein